MAAAADPVRELYRLAVRGNPDEVAPLIEEDATWRGADGAQWKPCETRDEIVRTLVWRSNALRMRPVKTVPLGSRVFVELTGFRLRQLGGRGFFVQRLYQVVTLRNGRVATIQDFAHAEQAFAEVGLRPS